ncbi:MAG: amidase family protein [Dongiaceae bacterium]
MNDLVAKSAREIRALIGAKSVSPVEVFNAFATQIEQVNPAINAIVTMDLDRGQASARKAEQAVMNGQSLGQLHGLPVGINDVQLTAGLKTTFGSLVHKDNVPDKDDLIVSRIRKAGGIIIGKTNTPEFGAGANTINRLFGATVNPFDTTLSASGSSGGSAAALATDMIPLATGGDLGGSLRTPAAFCGVVGHRPSPGTCPSDRAGDGWSPLAVEGAMARDVGDTAFLLGAMTGKAAMDPISRDLSPEYFTALPSVRLDRIRVAFSTDMGSIPIADDIRECFESAAARMAPLFGATSWGHPDCGDVDATFEALRAAGFGNAYSDYVRQHRDVASPNVISNVEFVSTISVADIGRAHVAQTNLFRKFQTFFESVDILICPAAPVVPFPVDEIYVKQVGATTMESYIRWIAINYVITLSTHPTTVIPAGLGPTGLPFGIQIVGRHLDDAGTLAIAAAMEASFAKDPTLARPKPDIARLRAPGLNTLAGRISPGLTNDSH